MSQAVLRSSLKDWDEYLKSLLRATVVDTSESKEDQLKRIERLEANPEEWFKYYFPNYCYAEPTPWHKKSTRRVLDNMEVYLVRAWSRDLAKSARTMMEDFYLALTGKKKAFLEVSNNHDDATRLLKPYKINFESNQRIIYDYGEQKTLGDWKEDYFVTKCGASFLAVGVGESPRGTRNEEYRPDKVNIDDFDTDQDCRNPDTVENKWSWLEKAVFGTRSISNPFSIVFNGNIIAEICCINKAIEMADFVEIINIRDANGKSTWPGKNTEAMIDRVLSKISYSSQQGEYFNNPITNGRIFNHLNYKKIRPFREYKFLVAYTDPSYKSTEKNDFKATALIGKWRDEYHVIRMFCKQTTTDEMLEWQYKIMKEVNGVCPVYYVIEWPSIDEPLLNALNRVKKKHDNKSIPLMADPRGDKGSKYHRIESLLEPLNNNEELWFNEELKPSEHMKACDAQFLAISPTSRAHDDGPDAVEGAVFFVNSKTVNDLSQVGAIPFNRRNDKRL